MEPLDGSPSDDKQRELEDCVTEYFRSGGAKPTVKFTKRKSAGNSNPKPSKSSKKRGSSEKEEYLPAQPRKQRMMRSDSHSLPKPEDPFLLPEVHDPVARHLPPSSEVVDNHRNRGISQYSEMPPRMSSIDSRGEIVINGRVEGPRDLFLESVQPSGSLIQENKFLREENERLRIKLATLEKTLSSALYYLKDTK